MSKYTAADRPQFRRDVAALLKTADIEVGEPESCDTILCQRASDFDPESNILWELEANRSEVRPDVQCVTCKQTVAMSHGAYGHYSAADKRPKVCCVRCIPSLLGPETCAD